MSDGDPELWDKPGMFQCSTAVALLIALAGALTRKAAR